MQGPPEEPDRDQAQEADDDTAMPDTFEDEAALPANDQQQEDHMQPQTDTAAEGPANDQTHDDQGEDMPPQQEDEVPEHLDLDMSAGEEGEREEDTGMPDEVLGDEGGEAAQPDTESRPVPGKPTLPSHD